MVISWEMLILFSALFVFIVMLAYFGIWSFVEEGGKAGKLIGSILVLLSYALFMAMFYCLASGCLI